MISSNTKQFCCDDISLIKNYSVAISDNSQIYDCHHYFETHNSEGKRRLIDLTSDELKALNMYYKRPSDELIFLTKSEHMRLHSENRENIIADPLYQSQLKWFNNGVVEKHTKECPEGFVEGRLSFSKEHIKNMLESRKDFHYFNNGKIETRARECPKDFIKGRLPENVKYLIDNNGSKGYYWWNNGLINKYCKECPEGFVAGRCNYTSNVNKKKRIISKRIISKTIISIYKDNILVGTFPKNMVVENLNSLFPEIKATDKGWGKAYYKDKQNPVFYYKGLKFVKD